ncbi:WD40/YVTN/BNR-like repeat-containing protein, partial [Chloroflexota bacterium]
VNIPTEGETGNWVLASGTNVRHLAMAVDGTLYSYANPSGTNYTLFKSTDAGYRWSHTGKIKDSIVALATAPDDANIVYYATASNVYESTDGGNSFISLPPNPGGAGSNSVEISGIDVARLDGNSIIAVGTRDTDASQYGGVYILDENKPSTIWANTNIGNYDVCAVAFSPDFTTDRQLMAVVTDETDTLVASRISDDGWGTVFGDATIEGLAPRAAGIAFPNDYDATADDYTLFVALDSDNNSGDVYMVRGAWAPGRSMATDLDIGDAYNLNNVDVTGLAVSGNTTAVSLLAGAANSTQVYISTDSGTNWTRSSQAPTGQSETSLLMAPDFTSSGIAYAATSGTESAFSYTADGGATWKQLGLIDTAITTIVDLAVSPDYGRDNTLFMLTFGGEHSLWRSFNGGAKWERIFTSALANVDEINLVEFSPQYGSGSQVVFLAGASSNNSVVWKSADNGQAFTQRGTPFPIDILTVVNDNTLFLGSYDGTSGLVYRTINSGLSYSTGTAVGSQPLRSMTLSPSYEQDETLLIGNTYGWVYWSEDNGTSFKLLGQQIPEGLSPTAMSNITVDFDPKFNSNKVVYAASDIEVTEESKERIHRFIIGKSDTWESIDSTLPVGSMLNQLAVSANGALYATNSQTVDAVKKEGGMERSLNPTYSLGPTFETVIRGLDDGAALTGLWLRGSQLWSIDSTNTRLMTYINSLDLPVTLTSPPD